MSRFMAAAAAADQGDFAFFFVGPDDDGPIIEFAQLLRCRFDQALNHFLFNVIDIIDNFFHDNPFFLDILKELVARATSSFKWSVASSQLLADG